MSVNCCIFSIVSAISWVVPAFLLIAQSQEYGTRRGSHLQSGGECSSDVIGHVNGHAAVFINDAVYVRNEADRTQSRRHRFCSKTATIVAYPRRWVRYYCISSHPATFGVRSGSSEPIFVVYLKISCCVLVAQSHGFQSGSSFQAVSTHLSGFDVLYSKVLAVVYVTNIHFLFLISLSVLFITFWN